jgi:acetoin utilization deacetylase AcuC-like enzyme
MTRHDVFYNADYVSSDYAFDTTRKSALLAAALEDDSSVDIVDPGRFTERTKDLIDRLHGSEYVQAVRTGTPSDLAESQGFEWDPKLPTMAIAHSAGLVAAVSEVLTSTSLFAGSLSSGLHHARRDRGAGYCTFNGLAVAATEALDRGAKRILVLDFDAHCGGGTRSMTSPDAVVQIDVSTVMFDGWPPGTSWDSLTRSGPARYLDDIAEALQLASRAGPFDLVLYNAGMDPANSGVDNADLALRERMVAEWAAERGQRLVYTLAGGYTGEGITMDDLVALHRLTVDAFCDEPDGLTQQRRRVTKE